MSTGTGRMMRTVTVRTVTEHSAAPLAGRSLFAVEHPAPRKRGG